MTDTHKALRERLRYFQDGKRVMQQITFYQDDVAALLADHDALRARVAELEADAERLNWLQANPRLSTIVVAGQPDRECYMYAVAGAPGLKLREIIDAARGVQ